MNLVTAQRAGEPLERLHEGMPLLVGGDRVVRVSAALAEEFRAGDRLVVVHDTGDVLHLPARELLAVDAALAPAVEAFHALGQCTDDQIDRCFQHMATLLDTPDVVDRVEQANRADVIAATQRGRSTTRLVFDEGMRVAMVDGLRMWAGLRVGRDDVVDVIHHQGWLVETRRAPLGVVGFVFEGRPNVLVDAAGVLRSGNTAVLRIGRDALGTARALMTEVITPSLAAAGLPPGALGLVDATSHASGWALFADQRLGLAVARGSGPAVAQLGAVARQAGTPVSLHGTGGAWLVAGHGADADWLQQVVRRSLDRKVCNTLNVCCVVASRADELVPVVVEAHRAAARARGASARLHVVADALRWSSDDHGSIDTIDTIAESDLAREWEWERDPEMSLVVVDDLDHAIALCNRFSPRFVASLVSNDDAEQQRFWQRVDAPFVGNGFTRWVDGQYALGRPELGLSNWEGGRLFARGGVLSGDSVHTLRLRAVQIDPTVQR
jgi:glutamate-5-semialdehyde dehydrogenase